MICPPPGALSRARPFLRLLPLIREHGFTPYPVQPDDYVTVRSLYLRLLRIGRVEISRDGGATAVEKLSAEVPNA